MELHRLANELMGTYQDVYLAFFEVFQQLLGLLGRARPGQVVDTDGEVFQARLKGLEMLIGQHGGRHEDGYLLGVASCLESGTHGDLGLAEAHIATDEAIHRTCTLHIGLDIVGGLQLVGSVFIQETGFQFVLHKRVG